ncbi:hypothetical protein [Brasilonema sp. UFV-L1]|uniref:hypothetical protein n=1 Tax=Brasilonema sp. UFV-L1 TaxID=2234130 RepID=UPI00145D7EA1|nr:hypothetical protein [Brasilonema sp. UFV-L1]NMG11133.1 hypothetical protein [Brasilonema sp. UFV-L1]
MPEVELSNPVMYNGITYTPNENNKCNVPDEVAEALGLKAASTTLVEDTAITGEELEPGAQTELIEGQNPPTEGTSGSTTSKRK